MAQRSSRKRRKARQRAARPTEPADAESATPAEATAVAESETPATPKAGDARVARGYARGRARDDAARAALEPLAEGERPLAVTIAGVVALVLALSNLGAFLAGLEVQGERPAAIGVGLFSGLLLVAAYGCFRVRYWAVLGMQALLGLTILLFSLLAIRFGDIGELAIAVAIIAAAGTLFWFLVKSMARIQMPDRPGGR